MKAEMKKERKKAKRPGSGWRREKDPTGEGHAAAGRIGGAKTSEDKQHMASIGSRGGSKTSSNKEHMAEIGRKGALARWSKREASILDPIRVQKEE